MYAYKLNKKWIIDETNQWFPSHFVRFFVILQQIMKVWPFIGKCLRLAVEPIRRHWVFFLFMYVLGLACAWIELHPWEKVYGNLYLELFFDLYLACLLLTLLPRRVGKWVRRVLTVLFYAVSMADVYCFVKYGSVLNPSMLMLVGETNAREAGEFLGSLLNADVLFSKFGWVTLIMVVHIVVSVLSGWLRKKQGAVRESGPQRFGRQMGSWLSAKGAASSLVGGVVVALLVWSAIASWPNKAALWRLMTLDTIGQVEHELTRSDCGRQYEPPYRLAFSVRANQLASQQIDRLIMASDKAQVDSCSFTTPNIVLIIGESFGRHHSQQYGYFMPTTPRQSARERTGLLVKYTDVVAPWNLTSFVFKNVFSMHVVGQQGEWCDYRLFPELFRKAGYHVTFLTNQFLPQAKEAVYDFSGGFFLNNPTLSKALFDVRNEKLHVFDKDLIDDYEQLKQHNGKHNLTIFHLLGQHMNYRVRCPNKQKKFQASDYEERRPELSLKQRKILADYDNATLYNDSVVDQIVRRFEDQDAVVIYMPDHGEECYEGNRGFICRNHSAAIDYDLARFEFEIPFWIYCSHPFAVAHPELYKQIVQAKNRRLMTDALPHMLLYLAGIHCKDYQPAYNVLCDEYDEMRPRILKNTTDYDRVMSEKRDEQ